MVHHLFQTLSTRRNISVTPYVPVLYPADVPGAFLWFDGKDPLDNGGDVPVACNGRLSYWVDKINGWNAKAYYATTTPATISTLSTIAWSGGYFTFNGSGTTTNYFASSINGGVNYTGNSLTAFVVAYYTAESQTAGRLLGLGTDRIDTDINSPLGLAIRRNLQTNPGIQVTRNNNNTGTGLDLKGNLINTLVTAYVNNPSGSNSIHVSPGATTSASTMSTAYTTANFGFNYYRIGAGTSNFLSGNFFNGNIGTIILYSTILNSASTIAVQNYLIQQFNLVNSQPGF